MFTARARVLVGTFAVAATFVSTSPIAAQTRVGSVLENGQVVVKIYVTMNQAGLPTGRPISDYTFLVISPSGERSSVTTSDVGTTELHLRPGTYRVLSVKPLDWYGHRYLWDLPFEVREGMHVLDLTPRNSADTDTRDERVALAKDRVARDAPAARVAPAVERDRSDPPSAVPPAYLYKSPGEAALFSFLVPGVGQMYNGQVGKGVALLLVSVGGVVVAASSAESCGLYSCSRSTAPVVLGLGVSAVSWIYSIFDAYSGAKRYNQRLGFRVGTIPVAPYIGAQRGGGTAVGLSLALR